MKEIIAWRKPELICLDTEKLVCKIKVKASSLPSCVGDYSSEMACPELSTGETWCNTFNPGDDGGVDVPCGILTQCVEVGPLFGCANGPACSTMAPVLK